MEEDVHYGQHGCASGYESIDFCSGRESLVGLPGYPTSLFIDAEGTLVGAAPFMLTLDQLTMQLDQMGVPRKAAEE